MNPRRPFTALLAVLATVLLVSTGVGRADTSVGLHGGFSSSPDQFIVGPHVNLAPVADNLYIVPSGEVGFGDHAFTMAFNGDLQYRFVVHRSKVRPYAGGGLSVYFVDPEGLGGSDTHMGADILGGMFFGKLNRRPMFVDVKLGLTTEVPDWKFQFGFEF